MFLPCRPCCGSEGCGVDDGKPRTDPKDEGTWVPSGTWLSGVSWAFVPNPGDESGNTWFFFGSEDTSKPGGGASVAEIEAWDNLCNWYSNCTLAPGTWAHIATLVPALDKRATRLPPDDAVVHVLGTRQTNTYGLNAAGSLRNVSTIYFWNTSLINGEVAATTPSLDSLYGIIFYGNQSATIASLVTPATANTGCTFVNYRAQNNGILSGGGYFIAGGNYGVVNGGGKFVNGAGNRASGVVNGLAVFSGTAQTSLNEGTCNDGGVFGDAATTYSKGRNTGIVHNGGVFYGTSSNSGTINGGGVFFYQSENYAGGIVNDGAVFYEDSANGRTNFSTTSVGVVNGGAEFYNNSANNGTNSNPQIYSSIVNGAAAFYDTADNLGVLNNDAVFNNASKAAVPSRIFGTATFNDQTECRGLNMNGDCVFNDSSIAISCNMFMTATFNGNSNFYSGRLFNGDATFNDTATHGTQVAGLLEPVIYGNATFNDDSACHFGIVNGTATFNDNSGTTREIGLYDEDPENCTREFVVFSQNGLAALACNTTLPSGCDDPAATKGCG